MDPDDPRDATASLYHYVVQGVLQYHVFSGHAWFTAAAVILLIALFDLFKGFSNYPRLAPLARVLLLLAIGLGILSGTPLPVAAAVGLLGTLLVYGGTLGRFATPWARLLPLAVAFVALACTIAEAQFHGEPRIAASDAQELVVVGDSLASGGFGEQSTWPRLLASSANLPLVDMSVAGQTTSEASRAYGNSLARLAPASLVIIELGGNDVLGDSTPEAFAQGLDALVHKARLATPNVLVVELPVLPGGWEFAAAQRAVVERRGALLVPKRLLAAVLSDPANTSDGIHLTQAGHDELARRMALILEK